MPTNRLYLAVLPLIHLSSPAPVLPFLPRGIRGITEQVLTLFPDKTFATEFYPEEVDSYIQVFNQNTNQLSGGHVTHYNLIKQPTDDGRVVVMVEQYVS
jgi:hypothetical protein